MIIGVHTPEFGFEKSVENVESFIRKKGIEYPVVMDSDYRIWNAFKNSYWPRKYLIDAKGNIRYDHAGEGGYRLTEELIQDLLKEIDLEVELAEIITDDHEHNRGAVCYTTNPRVILRLLSWKDWK